MRRRVGVITTVLLFAVVLGVVGSSGGSNEIAALLAHLRRIAGSNRSPWLWPGVLVVGAVTMLVAIRSHHHTTGSRPRFSFAPVRDLARRPGPLVVVMFAAGAMTLVLAIAFALTTYVMPRPASVGALVIDFMLGSAASNALLVPAASVPPRRC